MSCVHQQYVATAHSAAQPNLAQFSVSCLGDYVITSTLLSFSEYWICIDAHCIVNVSGVVTVSISETMKPDTLKTPEISAL